MKEGREVKDYFHFLTFFQERHELDDAVLEINSAYFRFKDVK